jgi:hypothetical protein
LLAVTPPEKKEKTMFHNEIRIQPLSDGRYVVSVDGGSKECATWSEVLAIIESEGGVPLGKAHRDLFEKCKAVEADLAKLTTAMVEMTADRDKYKAWWNAAYEENRQLKAAIVAWFLRAFKEG